MRLDPSTSPSFFFVFVVVVAVCCLLFRSFLPADVVDGVDRAVVRRLVVWSFLVCRSLLYHFVFVMLRCTLTPLSRPPSPLLLLLLLLLIRLPPSPSCLRAASVKPTHS